MIIVILVIALLVVSQFVFPPSSPKSADQQRLDRTITYFVDNYDARIGLIPEYPGNSTYWLYSDNYLAALAVSRYDPTNESTSNFGSALYAALEDYSATIPSFLVQSQYTALNSTSASFRCSTNYVLAWLNGTREAQGTPPVVLKTTANDGPPKCSFGYVDLLLLQAIYYHKLGNLTASSTYYEDASADFDGVGFADIAYTNPNSTSHHVYQTYKLALFVYASSCLGHTTGSSFETAENLLFALQDNSTGGFYTGYTASSPRGGTGVNTETTALAALALEQLNHPSSSC
jgi:hypothetical protein